MQLVSWQCRKEGSKPKQAKRLADGNGPWSAPAAQPHDGRCQNRQQAAAAAAPGQGDAGEAESSRREKAAHEEVTDMAYEAADHAQNFAEEVEVEV